MQILFPLMQYHSEAMFALLQLEYAIMQLGMHKSSLWVLAVQIKRLKLLENYEGCNAFATSLSLTLWP